MELAKFKERLKSYKKKDIIFTEHSELRAMIRNIDLNEVKENIINPKRLVHVKSSSKERYECYFSYSKNHCHKYVIALNRKVIIITIININRDWQKMIRR